MQVSSVICSRSDHFRKRKEQEEEIEESEEQEEEKEESEEQEPEEEESEVDSDRCGKNNVFCTDEQLAEFLTTFLKSKRKRVKLHVAPLQKKIHNTLVLKRKLPHVPVLLKNNFYSQTCH